MTLLPGGFNDIAPLPSTGTLTEITADTSAKTILAANVARKGATILNKSSAVLYLRFGAGVTPSLYTVLLAPENGGIPSYYEVPFGYTGIITGVWAAATGSALVTEVT